MPNHYNPNQPRVPKGHSNGGEWTAGGSHGMTDFSARMGFSRGRLIAPKQSVGPAPQILRPGHHAVPGQPAAPAQPLVPGPSAVPWFPPPNSNHQATSEPEQDRDPVQSLVKSADDHLLWAYDAVIELHRKKRIQGALDQFERMSRANTRDSHAILEFRAQDYSKRIGKVYDVYDLDRATQKEVENVCERFKDVQAYTNEGAGLARKEGLSGFRFGNFVHRHVEVKVKAQKDTNFTAERSIFLKKPFIGPLEKEIRNPAGQVIAQRTYEDEGTKRTERGSIRLDVFERVDEKTLCIYDVKTGIRGLDDARFSKLFEAVAARYKAWRILIIQVRPHGQGFEAGRFRP